VTPDDDQTPQHVRNTGGWSRPTWAERAELNTDLIDAPSITFTRASSLAPPARRADDPTPGFGSLSLTRTDALNADGDCVVTIRTGEVLIIAAGVDDLTPAEARMLAAALLELADLAEHG
jgi:hypothetical protein